MYVSGMYEERGHNSPLQVAQEAIGFTTARFHAIQSIRRLHREVSASRVHSQRQTYTLPLPSGSSVSSSFHYLVVTDQTVTHVPYVVCTGIVCLRVRESEQ